MRWYYGQDREHGRLRSGDGLLEFVRTQELLRRFLPEPPAVILDVGGAAGIHAEWLVADGYRVDLIDPMPSHVHRASQLPGVHAEVGNALALPGAEYSYDMVLLLGPLYHLIEAGDRARAWREAFRVVKRGAPVAAATISRFAPLSDGARSGYLDDSRFREVAGADAAHGQHRPPPDERWFTEAYLHYPTESVDEASAAGLTSVQLYAIEGTAWMLPNEDLDAWLTDPQRREHLLWALRQTESEPALLGASSHLLTVGRKP